MLLQLWTIDGVLKSFCPPDSPSPRQKIDFNKWVREAVDVPRSKVSGLQDVNYQVAELLVIVDLKLYKETAELEHI